MNRKVKKRVKWVREESLTKKHVDEDFAQTIEDDAKENRAATDSRVEGKTNTGGHESGREDEDPAIH